MNSASLRHILHQLAEAGRTGALYVGGSPGGVLYLVAGHLTYAASPACPGVGERLVMSGRVPADVWRAAFDAGSAECRVGRALISDGHLGQHELACRIVAAISDATHAVLQSGDATVRFAEGERHWLGVITTVELGALIAETARRLRTAPAPRAGSDVPWAGRAHPGWPRRTLGRPDHASLKRIRRAVTQAS